MAAWRPRAPWMSCWRARTRCGASGTTTWSRTTLRSSPMTEPAADQEGIMARATRTSGYDQYADEYAAYVAWREEARTDDDPDGDPLGILPTLLAVLGEVAGQDVLDAGCGEGYLS